MTKNILQRREEKDIYPTHVYRHHSAPAMSTDVNKVGITLFPCLKFFF